MINFLRNKKIKFQNEKIILTGNGRVANGALEVLKEANIKEVSKEDFISETYNKAVKRSEWVRWVAGNTAEHLTTWLNFCIQTN